MNSKMDALAEQLKNIMNHLNWCTIYICGIYTYPADLDHSQSLVLSYTVIDILHHHNKCFALPHFKLDQKNIN